VTTIVVHHILLNDWNKVTFGNCVESCWPKLTMHQKIDEKIDVVLY
jgi:hypothetical protein